ncbi:MAG: ATP-binding cassette domain-containing protein [Gemmatimonadales bacterium]|nr:ATP-binding cassette domain-containing protein [Gemmatimonadales bacterium]
MQALRGADFTLAPGEVHALLGENGAGKTTLMHVAYGLVRPDAGTIHVDGVAHAFRTPRAARAAGIGLVPQHPLAIPTLTVAENLALALDWPVAPGALAARVREETARLELPLEPAARVEALPVALQQRLEIVKALAGRARVLLLDEPTAVLAPVEAEALMRRVRAFAAGGGSVVLITHKLEEALGWSDRVTVLRRGAVVASGAASAFDAPALAAAMVGSGAAAPRADERTVGRADVAAAAAATILVRAAHLEVEREDGSALAVREASFELRAGEIAAVAAVEGNGQRELLRAVAGVLPVWRGMLEVAPPVAFIPEDRTTEGLIPALDLTANVVLGVGRAAPWVRGFRLLWPQARARTGELIAQFGVRAAGPSAPASSLSGGNQQKVVIARALERHPRVLVAENPTRGLDVAATAAVHERLRAAAAAGCAVLVHSSDLDEVVALGGRLFVMSGGTLRAVGDGATRAEIGALMAGVRVA